MPNKRPAGVDAEIDALFRLPLADFTSARNALAARLKKEGRAIDAGRVKSLAKPPAPAWAVNQLYWRNPKAIDQLAGVAERVRKAQTGRSRNADIRDLLDEKKRLLGELVEQAAAILSEAGHATSPDAMRRVSATLESLAVSGKTEGAPKAGRLTADLDPPGFEALAAAMGGAKIDPTKVLQFRASKPAEDQAAARARAREAVQAAEKELREAQREAERAQAALTKAKNEAKKAAQAVAAAERSLNAIRSR